MQRFHQILFIFCVLALSWLVMMAVHELGHVMGAVLTGGTIQRVVLHPLTISRTDVLPNPNPLVVVWLGPLVGCVLPLLFTVLVPKSNRIARAIAFFFAGFCLIANGAYIALGSIDSIGDFGVMLESGSPIWTLIAFGIAAISLGLFLWHRLGTIKEFLAEPSLVDSRITYVLLAALLVLITMEFYLSPR